MNILSVHDESRQWRTQNKKVMKSPLLSESVGREKYIRLQV